MTKLLLILALFWGGWGVLQPTIPFQETSVNLPHLLEDEDLTDVQVPIERKDRVANKTGIQCVWSSIETLGRFAEEKKLIDLTENPSCRSYSGPSSAASMMNKLKIRFEQTTSKSDRSLIIKGVVKERRGVLFSVPGHAMVLVHYDEEKKVVKYINNSDKELKVRTWTMDEFNRRWDGWVMIIYADNDIIASKYFSAQNVPIKDILKNQPFVDPKYILMPRKN